MPNEFEKIVQQKMDELNLVPSAPVWQRVEMQIRRKKERRRLFFWIPLLALLSGGGLWLGMIHYSKDVSYPKSNSLSGKPSPGTPKKIITTTTPTADEKTADRNIQEHPAGISLQQPIAGPATKSGDVLNKVAPKRGHKNGKAGKDVPNQRVDPRQLPLARWTAVANRPGQGQRSLPKDGQQVLTSSISEIERTHPRKKMNPPASGRYNIHDAAASAFSLEKLQLKPLPLDSTGPDTATAKTGLKKTAPSKWKYRVAAAAGLSGLSRLTIFNGLQSASARYYYAPSTNVTGPGTIYYGPSAVQKGVSFSLGGVAQRQVSRRLVFSMGLQYNFYSNSHLVGSRIVKDTSFEKNYSVSQYFTTVRSSYSSSMSAETYHNRYHFISVPLTIDWQVFKNLPLNFQTGFSIQQLIQTNALVFDYNAQAYYHNNNAFKRTLVFTQYGLAYSIPLHKMSLAMGPEFQYGLTRLEKTNSDHHLFYYGWKAQLQLHKK